MSDVNLALTAAEQALKAKIEAGSGTIPLEITRIVTASGRSDDPLNLTAVVNEEQQFTIKTREITGVRTAITVSLTNMGNPETGEKPLEKGYPLSQVGFYAIDPDDGEILYRVSQYDAPNYVPASHERGWTYEPTYNIVTGNASEVKIVIDYSGAVTTGQLAEVERLAREALTQAQNSSHTIISDTMPEDQPEGGMWLDTSDGPIEIGETGIVIANAVVSDTEPTDGSELWLQTHE